MSIVSLQDITSSDQAPSLPEVALRIIEVAQQADPDTQELIEVVRMDPAIAGQVLKFANSALFGLRHRPSSIEAAVPMLGTTLVRTLVLGFSLAEQKPSCSSVRTWFRILWRESLFQASAAELLAEKTGGVDAPTWFLGGLLQDIGQLAMLNVMQDDYLTGVLKLEDSRTRFEREQERYGFTHADVSAEFCRKWNLEAEFTQAVADHHQTIDTVTPENITDIRTGLSAAAACSSYMDAMAQQLNTARNQVERILIDGWGYLPDEMVTGLADMDSRAFELGGGFGLDVADLPSRGEILDQAQAVLRKIALENRLEILNGLKVGAAEKLAETSGWDEELESTYNQLCLDHTLPQELKKSHADGATVGLLEIDLSDGANTVGFETGASEVVSIVTNCVRTSDMVVRRHETSVIVMLKDMGVDLLQKLAKRIQNELNYRLSLTEDSDTGSSVGGVVVVPEGRKPAKTDRVLKTLTESVDNARRLSSSRIAFQILMGKKAKPLEVEVVS